MSEDSKNFIPNVHCDSLVEVKEDDHDLEINIIKNLNCRVCDRVMKDYDHYKSCKYVCKSCYISKVKKNTKYMANHKSCGMNTLSKEKLNEIYDMLKNKSLKYSTVAKQYKINQTTLRVWYNKEKIMRNDAKIKPTI